MVGKKHAENIQGLQDDKDKLFEQVKKVNEDYNVLMERYLQEK